MHVCLHALKKTAFPWKKQTHLYHICIQPRRLCGGEHQEPTPCCLWSPAGTFVMWNILNFSHRPPLLLWGGEMQIGLYLWLSPYQICTLQSATFISGSSLLSGLGIRHPDERSYTAALHVTQPVCRNARWVYLQWNALPGRRPAAHQRNRNRNDSLSSCFVMGLW